MGGMLLRVEVRDEDVDVLREMAVRDHRSVREQGGYLLHLKIHEEAVRLELDEPDRAVEVAP